MTMEHESGEGRKIVRGAVPWLVAAGALAVYLLTLNRWVSLLNLPQVAGAAGWKWQPELSGPVYYLLTLPLSWLPTKWIPLALNVFSAVCAALTLGQLARSVALLPHDRTHDQREREHSEFALLSIPLAWLPPLLAVLACGLQLTFWEHATNGTGEMLDLLMFSYVIRCILEYRIDERESRLLRAAIVYGAGMTNNFAMIGFFPAFLIAMIWLKGITFFNSRFLGRMTLCGLAGLSLYLLLPLIASLSKDQPISFFEAFKLNLLQQKSVLLAFPRKTLLLMSLTSLVPLLLISIRWASYFGDTSRLGTNLAKVMFHAIHAAFLVVCLWVALDPPFSPRNVDFGIPTLKFYAPFLTFYFLSALSVGYLSGYLLLVFRLVQTRFRRPSPLAKPLYWGATILVVALAVLVPLGLLYRNLPQIRATNGPMMRNFANALGEPLPKGGLLLSDDLQRLVIVQAWLAAAGREEDFVVIHSQSLRWPAYHRFLHQQHPQSWPQPAPAKRNETLLEDGDLVQMIRKQAETSEVWYLHPSFGYYFEFFFDEPHGLAYKLVRCGNDALLPPVPTPQLVAENEAFWTRLADAALNPIIEVIKRPAPEAKLDFVQRLFKAAYLPREHNAQAAALGTFYSRALNDWGVELQRANELEKAAPRFELAHQLNHDNVVSEINLQYNRDFRAGRTGAVELTKSMEDRFGKYRTWEQVLSENGPYDEPSLTYAQGYVFLQGRLFRQAAQAFDRVRALSPEDLTSRLLLAQLHLMAKLPEQALALTREIRAEPQRFSVACTNVIDLVSVEVSAHFARQETNAAIEIMEAALKNCPTNASLFSTVASLYAGQGLYPNAHAALDRQMKINPKDPTPLINKGVVYVQANAYDDALQALNRALTLQTTNQLALFYRAITQLRMDRLQKSREDYETLLPFYPQSPQIRFGLGEIELRQGNTNAAIAHYEVYLTNAPPNTTEFNFVQTRLKELKGEKPKAAAP